MRRNSARHPVRQWGVKPAREGQRYARPHTTISARVLATMAFSSSLEPAIFRQNDRDNMGLGAYFTRQLPEPKCVTEIPALRELWRLTAASLP